MSEHLDEIEPASDTITGPMPEPASERIDISYPRIVSIVKRVLTDKRGSEPPLDWQAAAKALAHYVKDGDTIRMHLEDVRSMTRHLLHLRAQVRELQQIGSDLLEENQNLRAFRETVDRASHWEDLIERLKAWRETEGTGT